MCGIAGFLSARTVPGGFDAAVRRMGDAISHRGPDDHGIWADAEAGIAFAHRRLSIVDLSPAGHQPMHSACSRYVITFNGEIYNHADLRRALESEGNAPSWRGHSDTEVLLAAIAAWGIERALTESVGMFAFGLWDAATRTLTLARDRLGEKPLYYGWVGGTFLFGSELTALRAHPDWAGEIDRNALAAFMRLNNVPAPHSIYRGVAKLEPGTLLTVRAGEREASKRVYWSAADMARFCQEHPFKGSADDAADQVEALIRASLAGQMLADVPLGAFLSGGIDSSTVVALMQSMSARPVRTFSIGFRETGYDEAPHAKAVARHLGTDHTELYVTEADALAMVPRLATIYSEPFADSSEVPTCLVAALARRHVTVALSGDGGDEVFSGYRRYALGDGAWSAAMRLPAGLRHGAARAISRISPAAWDAVAAPPLAAIPASRRPTLVGDKLHKAAGVLALDDVDAVYRALLSHWEDAAALVIGADEPADEPAPAFADPVRRMMYRDLTGYLPNDILAKVDRASMAVALEARVPLLDHRLVEFSWTLPLSLLRRRGKGKQPLRDVLARYVPAHLVERPKAGFAVPIDAWLRGPLRSWAEDLIAPSRLAREGLIDPAPVRAAWDEHQAGHRNHAHRLWNVLMFEAWHDAERATRPEPAAVSRATTA